MINIRFFIFFCLFILLLCLFKFKIKESFLPINSLKSMTLKETDVLEDQLAQFKNLILPDFKNSIYTFDKKDFVLDLDVIYYYNDVFQKVILEYINKSLSKSDTFKDYNLTPSQNLSNIYKKDIGNNRHYIFDIELFSKKKLFKVNLSIYLIVENMEMYLDEKNKYQKIIPLPLSSVKVANIYINDLETLSYLSSFDTKEYKSSHYLYDYQYYYNISTKLHIMQ